MSLRSAWRAIAVLTLVGLPVVAQSTVPPNLISQWHFDEGTGTTTADAVGTSPGSWTAGVAWAQGMWGSAVRPDGTAGYVDLGAASGLNVAAGAPFSISGWFRVAPTELAGPIVSFRHSVNDNPVIDICIGSAGVTTVSGALQALVRDDGGAMYAEVTSGTTTVNDDSWHHFALTRNAGAQIELFLDGVSLGTNSGAGSGGAITTDDRALGAELRWVAGGANTPDVRYLNGAIEEVQFYGRQLSLADIQTLAAPPAPTGVTATPGNGTVALSWSASASATGYTVRRGTSATGPWSPVVGSPTTGTTLTDTAATNGTQWFYVINATRGALTSVDSAVVSATPSAPPPPGPRAADKEDDRCGCASVSPAPFRLLSLALVLLAAVLLPALRRAPPLK